MSNNHAKIAVDSRVKPAQEGLQRYSIVALSCFLILLAAYRLTLIRTGHFFWGDEIRYLRAGELIDDVGRGDYQSAAGRLFQSLGRPGFILISVIPTWVTRLIHPDTSSSASPLAAYNVAAVFNVFISIGVTIALYALARAWRMRSGYALLAAVTYSLLAQSNVWIKHLVPYNESLLLFMVSLWLISRQTSDHVRTIGMLFLTGSLSAIAFATYPGHYMFVVINFLCVGAACRIDLADARATQSPFPGLGRSLEDAIPAASAVCFPRSPLSRLVLRTAAFSGGAISVVLLFECLAQFAGTTWIGSGRQFAPTMGLFSEGYVFAWHYLRDGEGLVGVLLAVLIAAYIAKAIVQRNSNVATVAILAAVVCYLIHATLGVFFHKTVFYGRILLMYVPFVVIGAVLVIESIRRTVMRRVASGVVLLAVCLSFMQFARGYAKLTYPADLWYDSAVANSTYTKLSPDELYGSRDGSPLGIVELAGSAVTMVADSMPEGSTAYIPLANHGVAQHTAAELIGVNIRWMFYISERNDRFLAPASHRLIAEARHPLAFPPLQFEGFRPCERKRMQDRLYTMRIYQRHEEVDSESDTLAVR